MVIECKFNGETVFVGVSDLDTFIKADLNSDVVFSMEINSPDANRQGFCTKGELEYIEVLDGV